VKSAASRCPTRDTSSRHPLQAVGSVSWFGSAKGVDHTQVLSGDQRAGLCHTDAPVSTPIAENVLLFGQTDDFLIGLEAEPWRASVQRIFDVALRHVAVVGFDHSCVSVAKVLRDDQ
jgi:hypothetical protein